MTRRELIAAGIGVIVLPRVVSAAFGEAKPKPLKFAVIADLHHGLAPDAMARLRAFVDEVRRREGLAFVVQMGDFCYSLQSSAECVELFDTIKLPKIQVLGNHDMDKVDKAAAMRFFGMKTRYGSHVHGGWRFVWLDLNNFRKDGKLVPYANGNYFTDGAECNRADPEQLAWLSKELRRSREPVILLSHQPLGFAEPGQAMPEEQVEVLAVIDEAAKANPRGAVAICMFGHLHVDRLEMHGDLPCCCVNSASYFWYGGMNAYTKPLFAFMELDPTGVLRVEGAVGAFVKPPPASSDAVLGRSASIVDRKISGALLNANCFH